MPTIWNLYMTLVYGTNIFGLNPSIEAKLFFTFLGQNWEEIENQFWWPYTWRDNKKLQSYFVE